MMISKNHNMYEDFTIANEKCSSIDNIWWFFIITCIIFLYVIRFCDKGSSFSEKSLWHNEHLFFVNSLYPESVCMLCLILKWWTKTHSRIILGGMGHLSILMWIKVHYNENKMFFISIRTTSQYMEVSHTTLITKWRWTFPFLYNM